MKKAGLVLVLALAAILLYTAFAVQAKNQIEQVVSEFVTLAIAGDPAAAAYLDAAFPHREAVLEAMGTPSLFLPAGPEGASLHSLSRASAALTLLVREQPFTLSAELVRRPEGWRITSFPAVQVSPAALLTRVSEDQVEFLASDGTQHTLKRFTADNHSYAVEDVGLLLSIDGTLALFEALAQMPVGKLLAVTTDTLEGEPVGILPLTEEAALFRRQDAGYRAASAADLVVGMQSLSFYGKDGEIMAVLLPENVVPETIRVVINTNGFGGLGHRSVELTATSPFILADKVNSISLSFAAGETLVLREENGSTGVTLPSGEQRLFANRLYILPDGGRVRVDSLRRGSPPFTPLYYGHMEVASVNGQLVVVNEVPLENYLLSVVPSEMPVSFGLTPLKVQAVAARTYAVSSILRSGFRRFAAHVDDSVASQVYNNVPEYEVSSLAVRETAGQVVWFDGAIADTRFFSASSGVTANTEETWHDPKSGAFPANPLPYLAARPQLASGSIPDVATEEGAYAFFTSAAWDGYDKASPWFRWDVEMTRQELEAVISRNLNERQKAQPAFVLTLEEDGFVQKKIADNPLGRLTDLRVIRRGAGGNIMELEIVATEGTYRLIKEYTIRFTLRPVNVDGSRDVVLWRHDGSLLNNYSILPSAFMVIDLERDERGDIVTVRFRGGGNGHGVGMSQWGSRGLAAKGFSHAEILAHYYPGTTLETLY